MSRVLVIEDDPWIATVVADELADRGCEVSIAANGRQALQYLESELPDVIVLDLMMPVMDGWDFLERYQSRTAGVSVPVIVVSAAGTLPVSMQALGVRRFLPKPFDLEELGRCVAELAGTPSTLLAAV